MIVPRSLVHVSDTDLCISRRRAGRGFVYYDAAGARVICDSERARIRNLGIPPAYTDVRICMHPSGHIQATGQDARGRRQYLYHPDWSAWRNEVKFAGLAEFGTSLSRIRAAVSRDLERAAGDRVLGVAAVVRLLDRGYLRIGTPAHARMNKTFGATTLLKRHLTFDKGHVRLRFRTKGGRRVQLTLQDRRLQKVFQAIDDLPGAQLFNWIGPDGMAHPVESHHVNAYLTECAGVDGVTAKTFRTWGGTLAAFQAAEATRGRLTKRLLSEAAAEVLHNTPAIASKSYVHPDVLALADEGRDQLRTIEPRGPTRLTASERRLIGFLTR